MRHKESNSITGGWTGKCGALLSVLTGLIAFSAQVQAGVVTVRTASCSPDGNTPVRHIQLREHTKSDIRCDVLYEKPDEGGTVKTIWTARNDVSFCASRFGDFVQKHRVKFGWHCSESTQVAELNEVSKVAQEPALTATAASASSSAQDNKAPEPVVWVDTPSITVPVMNTTDASDSLDERTLAAYLYPGEAVVSGKVVEIATALEAQKIGYNTEDLSDCSGVFHRVLANLQREYPTIELPKPDTHRSTRKLARWYLEHGSLKIVRSAVDEGDALRPGVVLFYGQRGKRYDNATPEELFKIGSGIAHMGVVVDVSRVDGQVVGYSLFHGRRTGTNASITNYHRRSPSRSTHPPYGNGDEHWVAYAPILPAGTLIGEEDLIAENTEEPELIAEITDEP